MDSLKATVMAVQTAKSPPILNACYNDCSELPMHHHHHRRHRVVVVVVVKLVVRLYKITAVYSIDAFVIKRLFTVSVVFTRLYTIGPSHRSPVTDYGSLGQWVNGSNWSHVLQIVRLVIHLSTYRVMMLVHSFLLKS